MTTERCNADGGQGIGAGHVCKCNAPAGHEPIYGVGHGCSCGAVWRDHPAEAHIEHTVTLPAWKEQALRFDSLMLSALEEAGVQNWEGYDTARAFYEDWTAE